MKLCGAINVLKPPGMTSFDVIQFLRKNLNIKKVGHAGTLDPSATGVLPVFIGKATKIIDDFIGNNKRYIAEIEFGYKTDSYDNDGEVVSRYDGRINLENIEEIIKKYTGKIEQMPPMHSAIKINGEKLYNLAHKGIEIDRPKRKIEIFELNIITKSENKILIDVLCSKGTYIRSLCNDIGEDSGYFGIMKFLLRTDSGIFNIEDALTLEEIKEYIDNKNFDNLIKTPDELYAKIPKLVLSESEKIKFFNGMTIEIRDEKNTIGKVGLCDGKNELYALGMIIYREEKYLLKKSIEFI